MLKSTQFGLPSDLRNGPRRWLSGQSTDGRTDWIGCVAGCKSHDPDRLGGAVHAQLLHVRRGSDVPSEEWNAPGSAEARLPGNQAGRDPLELSRDTHAASHRGEAQSSQRHAPSDLPGIVGGIGKAGVSRSSLQFMTGVETRLAPCALDPADDGTPRARVIHPTTATVTATGRNRSRPSSRRLAE